MTVSLWANQVPVKTWAREAGGFEVVEPPMRLTPDGRAHL